MQNIHSREIASTLAVVGGVYRERCRLPRIDEQVWGSGGRAAAVASGLEVKTTLHTVVDPQTENALASLGATFGFDIVKLDVKRTPEFRYDHGLSVPIIWPPVNPFEKKHIEVEADTALVFGMLDATAIVRAQRVVYDPQNPSAPEPLHIALDSRPRIAYVLNGAEARILSNEVDLSLGATTIAERWGIEVVVVKNGPFGAIVFDKGNHTHIPAYKTESVWPIGSGDVFAAVFATRWAAQGFSAPEAALQASRAAALYVNNRVLPIASNDIQTKESFPFDPLILRNKPLLSGEYHVYLAGPFFNIAQRWLIEESRRALQGMGLKVFSPLHDIGTGSGNDVAPKDIDGLKRSRVCFAIVDGLDAGTIFEVGYARSLGTPVVAFVESTPEEPLKMISGSGCDLVSDFVTAIYRTAWQARL